MLIAQTEKERENEREQQTSLQALLEHMAIEDTRKAIFKVANNASRWFEANGEIPPNFLIQHHILDFERLFSKQYKRTIDAFGNRTFEAFKSHMNLERKDLQDSLDVFQQLAKNWILENALLQAKLVAGTTQDELINIIALSQSEGMGVREIARVMRDHVGRSLASSRALTIAVTETHNAATWANLESTRQVDQELDIGLFKRWFPVEDVRTRPDHARMFDADAIQLSEEFVVGGEFMDRPGDPSASASQVVRCRCILTYERK